MFFKHCIVTGKMNKNRSDAVFGMIFYPITPELSSGSLKRKYLAFILLLAGWLVFCYWLYTKEIYPRLHKAEAVPWPVYEEDLEVPLAFRWGSDVPLAGKGFGEWSANIRKLDTAGYYFIVKSAFYRDEKPTVAMGDSLARKRAHKMIEYLDISGEKVLLEVELDDVRSDVRAHPFESVHFSVIKPEDLVDISGDTMEVCFPVRDSLKIPGGVWMELSQWLRKQNDRQTDTINLTGTADATGVSEAADIAWERALIIQKFVILEGWPEDRIRIGTGQRHLENPIKNRCVILYFD